MISESPVENSRSRLMAKIKGTNTLPEQRPPFGKGFICVSSGTGAAEGN